MESCPKHIMSTSNRWRYFTLCYCISFLPGNKFTPVFLQWNENSVRIALCAV